MSDEHLEVQLYTDGKFPYLHGRPGCVLGVAGFVFVFIVLPALIGVFIH